MQNAHFLQRNPYYQCGLAVLNQQSKVVKTMKFTSKGHIVEQAMGEEAKKQSGISSASKEQEESDEDQDAKLE